MEALNLKRKLEKAQLPRVINEAEAKLTHEIITEKDLRILSERLEQLHTDLEATDSDIVPLLSTTKVEAEFDRFVVYEDQDITTSGKLKYRIQQLQESQNRALPATPTVPVQRTRQLAIQLWTDTRKHGLMDGGTDIRTDRRADGCMDESTDGRFAPRIIMHSVHMLYLFMKNSFNHFCA
ncbi:hypothetical protein HPB51_023746 [Rhipicephalus microplus]|uniref:Uncharacterized protein n=1 Tax=Rhipicephalus microplus TaxID=6941 RepID=A0A9J6EK66_RHIMP|nr:hypothetical protein HPB51_023746 [Rhipicephalus microplus]